MPFKSDAQRRLFHAAKSNPALRKRTGLTAKTIKEFISKDKSPAYKASKASNTKRRRAS